MANDKTKTEDAQTGDPKVDQKKAEVEEKQADTPSAEKADAKIDEAPDAPVDGVSTDEDEALEQPTEAAPAGQVPDPDVGKFDIRTGDVWSANTDGESLYVVGITEGGDPVVSDSTGEYELAAETLVQGFRHDGPTHHEAGAARL
jgi:hypothetical protein